MIKMRSSELIECFVMHYDKESSEWHTSIYNKAEKKIKPMKVRVKLQDGTYTEWFICYKFYDNESATSCKFLDVNTGKMRIYRNVPGWEIGPYNI